jgi:hypothetical protein
MVVRLIAATTALLLAITSVSAQNWPKLPDRNVTPGRINQSLSLRDICSTKWGRDARAVTAKMKRQAIDAYGFNVSSCPVTKFKGKRIHRVEIDHLISRDIGGADDIKNLWPQCYEPVKKDKSSQLDGAHKKDRLEVELNKRICRARSTTLLREYQRKIRQNWIALYREIYGDD